MNDSTIDSKRETKEPAEAPMNPHEAITTGLAEARRVVVKIPSEKMHQRAHNTSASRTEPHLGPTRKSGKS